jgi:ATP-dependent Clp protease ATP-binding subunit ClpC
MDEAGSRVHLREMSSRGNSSQAEKKLEDVRHQKEIAVQGTAIRKSRQLPRRRAAPEERKSPTPAVVGKKVIIMPSITVLSGRYRRCRRHEDRYPVNRIAESENQKLLAMETELKNTIIGQTRSSRWSAAPFAAQGLA